MSKGYALGSRGRWCTTSYATIVWTSCTLALLTIRLRAPVYATIGTIVGSSCTIAVSTIRLRVPVYATIVAIVGRSCTIAVLTIRLRGTVDVCVWAALLAHHDLAITLG